MGMISWTLKISFSQQHSSPVTNVNNQPKLQFPSPFPQTLASFHKISMRTHKQQKFIHHYHKKGQKYHIFIGSLSDHYLASVLSQRCRWISLHIWLWIHNISPKVTQPLLVLSIIPWVKSCFYYLIWPNCNQTWHNYNLLWHNYKLIWPK